MLCTIKHSLLAGLCLLFAGYACADEVLWRSGDSLYIKQVKQENAASQPNEHPITLSSAHISDALGALVFWDKKYFKGEKIESVFTPQQIQQLGQYLAKGLAQAQANEDIVFALAGRKQGMFSSQDIRFVAGRVFYLAGKLNLLIGDYDRVPDKGLEIMYNSTGTQKVRYFFNVGTRKKASKFSRRLIISPGISYHALAEEKRHDWLQLDIAQIKADLLAKAKAQEPKVGNINDADLQAQLAEIARERREMRAEMARLRKDMQQDNNSGIEERLQHLQALKDKALISDAEYTQKRQQILSDI